MAASQWHNLRSPVANTRPDPAVLLDGSIAINTAAESPAVFFRAADGSLSMVGTAYVGATAPNATPGGFAGNAPGEFWWDTTATELKLWDGVQWVSAGGGGATGYVLPIASATVLGGVKVGANLAIDATGVLSTNLGAGSVPPVALPIATKTTLGGVIVGNGLDVAVDGTLSLALEVLELMGSLDPTAAPPALTAAEIGHVYIANATGIANPGFGLPVNTTVAAGDLLLWDGTAWVWNQSASVSGVTSVAGTLPITVGGTATTPLIGVNVATTTTTGVVSVGEGLAVDAAGVLSVTGLLDEGIYS
jgi:hypothetical protein